ncbi:hypothetical protein [Bacillus sp. V3-13]|nr:hypothetical protein [Bacillus sp. V3-13]
MKKKGDDEKMNTTANRKIQKTERKKKVQASFAKAVARNGKALERLSKN